MSWSADSRLAETIRERAAHVVLFQLQDPRLPFITVTRVKLAKDNATCRIFYSVIGSDVDRSKAAHALRDATGYVQREVGRILRTRNVPRLRFEYDASIEGTLQMHDLLDRLEGERGPGDEAPGETDSDPGGGDPAEKPSGD